MVEHISQNLEIQVVDHCNLDCVACSHESPLMVRRAEDPERLSRSLESLWRHYTAPIVKLLGGEPLLHREFDEVVRVVRAATGARVRLVTNGTLLSRRAPMLRGIDEIHVSSYPGIDIPQLDELKAIARTTSASVTVERFDSFRWHRSPHRHSSVMTGRIFKTCQLYQSWECHTVRDGRFYPCSPAATWGDSSDGVDLLALDDEVSDGLSRVLGRTEPLATCSTCLGSAGGLLPHQQGWRRASEPLAGAELDTAFLLELEAAPDAWNDCYEYKFTVDPDGSVVHHGR